jgi:hypothetical protein
MDVNAQPLSSTHTGAPQTVPSATQRPLAQQPTVHAVPPQHGSPGSPQAEGVVVVVGGGVVAVVVVTPGCSSGAQSSLAATTLTVLLPN